MLMTALSSKRVWSVVLTGLFWALAHFHVLPAAVTPSDDLVGTVTAAVGGVLTLVTKLIDEIKADKKG